MREAGLTATELGPEGFLPTDTDELTTLLNGYGLACVGGFVPVVLFNDDHDPARRSRRTAGVAGRRRCRRGGAGRRHRVRRLRRRGPCSTRTNGPRCFPTWTGSREVVAARGLLAVLHPHVGTMVETRAEVDRVLAGSRDPAVPGHRAPADRRHRSAGADQAGAGPHRARPPQGRRRRTGRQGAVRRADLHPGRRRRACTSRWAPVTSTSPASSRRWRTTATTAGTCMEQDNILDGEPDGRGSAGRRAGQRGVPAGRGAEPCRRDVCGSASWARPASPSSPSSGPRSRSGPPTGGGRRA